MMNLDTLDTGQASTRQHLIHDEIETVANVASAATKGLHKAVQSLSGKPRPHRHGGSRVHRTEVSSDATILVAARDAEGDVDMTGRDGCSSSTVVSTPAKLDTGRETRIRIHPVRTDSTGTTNTSTTDSNHTAATSSSGSHSKSRSATTSTEITVTTASGRSKGSSRKSKSSRSSDSAANHHPRVVYGPGAITQLPSELERLQLKAPVIVSSPSRIPLARKIQSLIPDLDSRILDSSVINVPTRVIDDAVARISNHDCVVSVGGDSAVGLAKSIGQRKRIPHICVPTTYSSAEPGLLGGGPGNAGKKLKYGNREMRGFITVVIYDEDLTMSMPKRFSAPTGFPEEEADGRRRKDGKNEDAQWGYLHLPGV